MIKLKLFFLIFLLAFFGCAALETKETFGPYIFDFGKVKEGAVLKHEFVFKNETSGVLNIKDVNTSCGCTVSEVKKRSLGPKESTVIEVKFNTHGYSGPTRQYIYVHTDNLERPVIRFIIKAEIIK